MFFVSSGPCVFGALTLLVFVFAWVDAQYVWSLLALTEKCLRPHLEGLGRDLGPSWRMLEGVLRRRWGHFGAWSSVPGRVLEAFWGPGLTFHRFLMTFR